MPSDQFVETMHRSAFAGQPAKARFPGHRHAGWVRVGFHFFQRSLFVYLTGVIFNRAVLSVQYRRIRNGIHYVTIPAENLLPPIKVMSVNPGIIREA